MNVLVVSVDAQEIARDSKGREYFEGRIVVKVSPDAGPLAGEGDAPAKGAQRAPAPREVLSNLGLSHTRELFVLGKDSRAPVAPTANPMRYQRARVKLAGIFVVEVDPGEDVEALCKRLEQDRAIEYAEPEYVFRLCVIPNDPDFTQQWYLHNTGQYYLEDADIDAPEAWDINQGSANPVIAIIDTGVDLDHPDLVNQIWANPVEEPGDANTDGFPGWAGFDDDGDGLIDEDSEGRQPGEPGYTNDLVDDDDENGYNDDFTGWNWIDDHNNPQDDHGHGTHCAGIAAAETDNAIGIAGTCPLGRIMPLKAFQSSGTASNQDIAEAVAYAYLNGAQVLSMSFVGPDSAVIRDVLELAYSTSVLVAAAGNDPTAGERYPAYYSWVIGVGATDVQWDDEISSYVEVIAAFTNTTNADIYAPGVSIRSTLLDDTYASWSGTSMATPIVAGIAVCLSPRKPAASGDPICIKGRYSIRATSL